MIQGELKIIPIDQIDDGAAYNVARGEIAPSEVEDLVSDIKVNGLHQPVVVRPNPEPNGKLYRLVAGFRRTMACKVLGLKHIPANIKNMDDMTSLVCNITENINRKNLSMTQEAQTIKALLNIDPTLNEFQIAEKLGQSRGWVQIRKYVLSLPEDIQYEIGRGYMTTEQIRFIWQIGNYEKQCSIIRSIKDAKARGERINLVKWQKNKDAKDSKEPRKREMIFLMMAHIQATLGNNFGTRCLAWASGEISDLELFHDIKNIADHEGKDYVVSEKALEKKPDGVII
jgi:ParB/RepB/Spo0J family partition protein